MALKQPGYGSAHLQHHRRLRFAIDAVKLTIRAMADDYDTPWKEAKERYFADFLHFYFPQAYAQIDWSQPHVFLDQELRAVVQDAELGKRFVDKLVRVTRQGGHPGDPQ